MLKILELYSGIGGMHLAFEESHLAGEIVAAVEINTTANSIYQHNFPETKLLNLNIEGLTPDFINKLKINTILMSPPCQPFTRNGNRFDVKDSRTDSFQHILDILPNVNIENLLIENVKGFESSEMRSILINVLKSNNFTYQEFILSPSQFGVPNSRHRYYCLAKKAPNSFIFNVEDVVLETIPNSQNDSCFEIKTILEPESNMDKYYLSDTLLRKRLRILDICFENSRRSCCFTKAYGRFIEGTGSVYTKLPEIQVVKILDKLYLMDSDSVEYIELARSLKLRFFTPREICRLMSFPDNFNFPESITNRQRYMVLGNSVNVKVVSELIKLLN